MSARHDDQDGSDIFWPGYVDATTNLILNLLFLLTILIVAVFMFALELGRSSKVEATMPAATPTPNQEAVAVVQSNSALADENSALKREIERLNRVLAEREQARVEPEGRVETVAATSVAPKPLLGLQSTLAEDFEVVVRFAEEAVNLTPEELDQLRISLQPIAASGQANVEVIVPVGFSESKRMGFYRAMTVRNLLLEMDVPKEQINLSVVEGMQNANASLVRVTAR
ncbi:MAG: hypothetical protein RQ723_05470 [Desulfuromonadales bacterium]|nr:hypothetical protein [Desulfuromonadales bacterium]